MANDNNRYPVTPVLHLVCGKIGSGKSSLAGQIAMAPRTILLSEDVWLVALYPNEIKQLADYVRCSERLKAVLGPHIESVLAAGNSVVLDFPVNTVDGRVWSKSLFQSTGVAHELHFLDVSDETCKARLQRRNAEGKHPFKTTNEEFDLISSYFVAPTEDEGFNIIQHKA